MVKWKWNVRSGRGIYGKKGFRFYILIWPKKLTTFWNRNQYVKEGGRERKY